MPEHGLDGAETIDALAVLYGHDDAAERLARALIHLSSVLRNLRDELELAHLELDETRIALAALEGRLATGRPHVPMRIEVEASLADATTRVDGAASLIGTIRRTIADTLRGTPAKVQA